jgi:hypothetical protein
VPSRHLHHTDARSAFRPVRSRQAWGSVLTLLVAGAVLVLWPSGSSLKLPALVALGVGYLLFTRRNWRCPHCGVILPYGRVPPEFTCVRCHSVLHWTHSDASRRPSR